MSDASLISISDVVAMIRRRHVSASVGVVDEAFRIADQVHAGERRLSGEPYIVHPLAVAQLLAQWGESPFVVALGLLHDVLDSVAITDELRACVGGQGGQVLEAVHSLDAEPDLALAQLQARFAGEPEVLDLIIKVKLADRMHNARTWNFVPRRHAAQKARQTRDALVPLARERGLHAVADELDRLSAGYLGDSVAVAVAAGDHDECARRQTGFSVGDDGLAATLLRRALDLLPAPERSRYAAEWAADLAMTRGRRQRLLLVAGFVYSARRLSADRRRTGPIFPRPSR